MATVSKRGRGGCPCSPAEDPGRQMSLDCRALSPLALAGQCITEQSAVSRGGRRCPAPSSEAERSSPGHHTPFPLQWDGHVSASFANAPATSVLVSLPISCNPQHFKTRQPADGGSLLRPRELAEVLHSASPELETAPILPAVPVLGDGYYPLQPQLLTLKEGYEHQPPGLPGDIKYHTEGRALSPGLCVQSRIFPSSVAETQPSSCKNAGE